MIVVRTAGLRVRAARLPEATAAPAPGRSTPRPEPRPRPPAGNTRAGGADV